MAFERHWALFLACSLFVGAACRSRGHERSEPDRVEPPHADEPWWRSAEDCRRSLELDSPRPSSGRARIGSLNVRWFPDGSAGSRRARSGTNVGWLACAIARLEVDVLAVQEFKAYDSALAPLETLQNGLNRHTGGSWQIELERCGRPEQGHVGLLWDASRVSARELREVPALLDDEQCDLDWRPGLAGYFRFPGGLDLHVVALHAVAGESRDRIAARARAFSRISDSVGAALARVPDSDLLLLGDYNTSGCKEGCEPVLTPADEIERLRAQLGSVVPSLKIVANTASCTEYHDDAPYPLDLMAVTRGLRELPENARVQVEGYCKESACSSDYLAKKQSWYDEISDHCPIVLELLDRDLD